MGTAGSAADRRTQDPAEGVADGATDGAGDGAADGVREAADGAISSGIGHRLRLRRKVRGLSLKQVSERSGLSIGLVSQIERGLTTPSLRSLNQICAALDMPMRWLFEAPAPDAGGEDDTVVRAHNRRRLDFGARGMSKELMSPDAVPGIQMMRITVKPGGRSGESPYTHPSGAKCGVVLSGRFGLEIDGRRHVLGPGDSFAFDAGRRHLFWCAGEEPCEVYWVVTPAVY